MRSLTFETHAFPTAPEGDLDHNNGMPGLELAKWLRNAVEDAGLPCSEPMQEDYGWGFWLRSDCTIWVAVSFAGGTQHEEHACPEWVVSVVHERPIIWPTQWFKEKKSRPIVESAFAAIRKVVAQNPNIRVLRDVEA